MKNPSETQVPEYPTYASLGIPVPGLDAAAEDLQASYPDLSEESLARILGLPTRSSQGVHSVVPVCQKREVAS